MVGFLSNFCRFHRFNMPPGPAGDSTQFESVIKFPYKLDRISIQNE